jgi:Subtilase family/Fibronectin type-III domain/Peptidase inhibitor I9/PA domain
MVVAHRRAGFGVLGALVLIAALLVGPGTPAGGAPSRSEATQSGRASSQGTGVYIVQMLDMPVVAYNGTRAGYPATASPSGGHVNPNSAQVRRYQDFLNRTHTDALRAAGATDAAKVYDYTFSYNGFSAVLTPAQAARMSQQPNVVSVSPDERRFPLTDNTPIDLQLTGPGGLWAQGPNGTVGENVIIGVIDTGIWPEHPSFSDERDLGHDPPNTDRDLVYGAPPAQWHGRCESGEQFSQQDCNNKLIGARWFSRGLELAGGQLEGAYASPRDADGHGTHTASTAGGNGGVPLDPDAFGGIFGRDLGVDTISGMAPRARIAAYKGCFGEAGCALSDLVASIDTAVSDGVDAINYSIGSDAPSQLAADADAVAFLFAAQAGVFVATSAGNAGQGAATVGSPADAPWVTGVGASTHSRVFQNTVTLGNNATYFGGSVTHGAGPAPLVDGGEACPDGPGAPDGTGDPEDAGLPDAAAGAIVLCLRVTGIPRVEHGAGVLAAGGVGMILYDPPQINVTPTDNHVLPTSHVSGPDGEAIAAYIESAGATATASFTAGTRADRTTGTEMAVFSSRGPDRAAPDIIKPDVTAPGVQILAGNSPTPFIGAPGQLFQAIQGTSMSSPHVAGVGALLVGAHPDWTPAMVRSALTTTGSLDVFKEDGTTPADPFDFGGGYIAPLPANNPGLVYDADFFDYLAFLCGNGDLNPTGATCTSPNVGGPIDPSDLNLASIGIAQLAGVQTVTRTVTNAGPAGTYSVSIDAPPGVAVDVEPAQLTLATGATGSYTVTFTSEDDAVFDEWTFGSLTWSDGAAHAVRSPIAIKPTQISAPEEIALTGTSGTEDYEVTFGYNGDFATAVRGLVAANEETRTVVDDPASDITVALETGVGIQLHTITVPAGTEHLRTSLFDDEVDGAVDDLDLYLYPPGEDPLEGGEFIALSGGGTAEEQIDIPSPEAGDWTLVVHGWETDGADAIYTLFTWVVGSADAGNLAAVPSTATAVVGETATISLTWGPPLVPLTADTRYLGIVRYSDGVEEFGGTFVSLNTGIT